MALPTFLIIGAGKAGTTSVNYYLGLHPEIQMSPRKETNFFAGPPNGKPYAIGQVESVEEYEQLFDPAVGVRGETSPNYAAYPIRSGAPARMKELVPEAKVIYLVRDPVSRSVSHHQHLRASSGEKRTLPELLAETPDFSQTATTCFSLYATQLEQYLPHFPQERILVLDQADLQRDRGGTLREIFEFLEVDPDFTSPEFDAQLLQTKDRRTYPAGYDVFVHKVLHPAGRVISPPLRRSLRTGFERALFRPLPPPELDDASRERLEEVFAPEAERLRAMTGKPFAGWSV
jgi:hypothetical protein